MKAETKRKLLEAWQYCDDEDKSTEFMLEYMQDFAGVDLDCVMNFIEKTTDKDRQNYIRAMAKERKIRKIEPYTRKWEKLANELARTHQAIRPCKYCGYPVLDGYCCQTCGSDNP